MPRATYPILASSSKWVFVDMVWACRIRGTDPERLSGTKVLEALEKRPYGDVTLSGLERDEDLPLYCQLPIATPFHSAMACRRWPRMPRAERCEQDGTKRLPVVEKIETKRCRLPGDRKPCIARSRFRSGTWEFSARLLRPLCERCSTCGIT